MESSRNRFERDRKADWYKDNNPLAGFMWAILMLIIGFTVGWYSRPFFVTDPWEKVVIKDENGKKTEYKKIETIEALPNNGTVTARSKEAALMVVRYKVKELSTTDEAVADYVHQRAHMAIMMASAAFTIEELQGYPVAFRDSVQKAFNELTGTDKGTVTIIDPIDFGQQ